MRSLGIGCYGDEMILIYEMSGGDTGREGGYLIMIKNQVYKKYYKPQ